jgi:hypothetical protein
MSWELQASFAGWDGVEQRVADGMEQANVDRWPSARRLHAGLMRDLEEAIREADFYARLEAVLRTLE